MYMYMYTVHVGVHVHVGVSQAFELPQWLNVPSLITKCGRDKPRAQNCTYKKKFRPGQKL